MAVGMPGRAAMKTIVDEVPIPVLDINRRIEHAEQTGLKIDLFASSAVPTAIKAHLNLLEEIRATGSLDVAGRRLDDDYLARLIDDPTYVELGKAWSRLKE